MKHIKDFKNYKLNEEKHPELREVKVTYSDGTIIPTSMAADLTDEDIKKYFAIGRTFNIGEGEEDNLQKVVSVEIIK